MFRSLICINLTYGENYHGNSSHTLTVETAVLLITDLYKPIQQQCSHSWSVMIHLQDSNEAYAGVF